MNYIKIQWKSALNPLEPHPPSLSMQTANANRKEIIYQNRTLGYYLHTQVKILIILPRHNSLEKLNFFWAKTVGKAPTAPFSFIEWENYRWLFTYGKKLRQNRLSSHCCIPSLSPGFAFSMTSLKYSLNIWKHMFFVCLCVRICDCLCGSISSNSQQLGIP
jgi:hypothetical protein